jgi:regulatory protein YycI of two-component signal transduction system YycFG
MYSKTKNISNKYYIVLFLFSTIVIFSSCKKENSIKEFNLDFSNLIIDNKENKLNNDTLSMIMDMSNAITEGIIFPTINQSNDGLLRRSSG